MPKDNGRVVAYEELVAILGDKKALQLCRLYHGRRLPSAVEILRVRRDKALIRDWEAGAQIGELSAKYHMKRDRVAAKLTEYTNKYMPKEPPKTGVKLLND